ncbi:MAG TPA: hypothetical protein VFP55_10570 [Solirubrobacteraceae bacterium]|nr:hypothetical protein [Solirubrobacteraceae bacterium]
MSNHAVEGRWAVKPIVKRLDRPQDSRTLSDRASADLVGVGEVGLRLATAQPGRRLSIDVKPAGGTDLCDVGHAGRVVSAEEPRSTLDFTTLASMIGAPLPEGEQR